MVVEIERLDVDLFIRNLGGTRTLIGALVTQIPRFIPVDNLFTKVGELGLIFLHRLVSARAEAISVSFGV